MIFLFNFVTISLLGGTTYLLFVRKMYRTVKIKTPALLDAIYVIIPSMILFAVFLFRNNIYILTGSTFGIFMGLLHTPANATITDATKLFLRNYGKNEKMQKHLADCQETMFLDMLRSFGVAKTCCWIISVLLTVACLFIR